MREGVKFVLVGPEAPLVAGLVDELQSAGIRQVAAIHRPSALELARLRPGRMYNMVST